MLTVDGKDSDRFLAELRFKNQLSEAAAQTFCWYHAGASESEGKHNSAASRVTVLSNSCFSAGFAIRVSVQSGLLCALCPSCLTPGELLLPRFLKLIFVFLQLPNFDLESESKNGDHLWNLQFTVRFLEHLASASNMSWILNFCTLENQRKSTTMGFMVLGMWKIVRECWECEADSFRQIKWLIGITDQLH